MTNNIRELLEATEKLNKENALLQKQLRSALESIEGFRSDKIDALVVANEKALKVYTEKTADQPYRILVEKMLKKRLPESRWSNSVLQFQFCKHGGPPLTKSNRHDIRKLYW